MTALIGSLFYATGAVCGVASGILESVLPEASESAHQALQKALSLGKSEECSVVRFDGCHADHARSSLAYSIFEFERYLFQIVVCGPRGIGKTHMLTTWATGEQPAAVQPTIGCDMFRDDIMIGKAIVSVVIVVIETLLEVFLIDIRIKAAKAFKVCEVVRSDDPILWDTGSDMQSESPIWSFLGKADAILLVTSPPDTCGQSDVDALEALWAVVTAQQQLRQRRQPCAVICLSRSSVLDQTEAIEGAPLKANNGSAAVKDWSVKCRAPLFQMTTASDVLALESAIQYLASQCISTGKAAALCT